jgi:dTDP-glucose pyrophosphorylase
VKSFKKHLILKGSTIKEALGMLNELALDAILFVVDEEGRLLGSLTDGDVRRGLLRNLNITDSVDLFIQKNPKFVRKSTSDYAQILKFRNANFRIIPIVDDQDRIVNVVNFRILKSYLPIDCVLMAGGKGERLRPLTDSIPKPMLMVGSKPIIQHNVDRLISFGMTDIWMSVNYLADKIISHFTSGSTNVATVKFIRETVPLGTIGAVRKISNFSHDFILVINSDILTDLNYEDFFFNFIESEADLSVVTIPYNVSVPYAVMETSNGKVTSFQEKPTYTYYSNGGIYLIKRKILDHIPEGQFFNATDLMEKLLSEGLKIQSYPCRGYWLDIGKPDDFVKAQEDIKHLNLY